MPNKSSALVTNEELAARLERAETRYRHAERRFRAISALLAVATVGVFVVPIAHPAGAQGYGITLAQAATRIAALETKTANMSVVAANDATNTSGYQTVRFSGVNVQIVSGTGSTNATPNGTGNLILGYNERRGSPDDAADNRTGSHSLVVGQFQDYSSSFGVVFGYNNTISGAAACVLGGLNNTASGQYASVLGGSGNTANGQYATVSGGLDNVASNLNASVSGGRNNTASGSAASVSGGLLNIASGFISSVSGGNSNEASGSYSTISGGPSRIITTTEGWVAGRRTGTSYTGYFNSP